jgi:hypothetical protein
LHHSSKHLFKLKVNNLKIIAMRFSTSTAVVVARSVTAIESFDQIDLQFSGDADWSMFQGDIKTSYSSVVRLFGEKTAQSALAQNALAIDDSAKDKHGRRLGTPAIVDAVLWDGAVLPYQIDASFGTNEVDIANLTMSMDTIANTTGVTFLKHTFTAEMNASYPSWVQIVNGGGCSSYVGVVNYADQIEGKVGAQPLTLKGPTEASPGTCRRRGTMMHEFLHALGLWHQQSMKNRDQRLLIYEEKIRPDRFYNWDKFENSVDFFATKEDPEGTAVYTYSSLMHYRKTAFANVTGETVMVAIDTFENGSYAINQANTDSMGQRIKLDVTDAIEIQILYHCHIENPLAGLEANFPVSNIRDLCSDRCQCGAQQGGCTRASHCKGDLYCAANVGVYQHLGQRMEIPGLNACLDTTFLSQFPAVVEQPSQAPTNEPTLVPSVAPTATPTQAPTGPTSSPSEAPTKEEDNSLMLDYGIIAGVAVGTFVIAIVLYMLFCKAKRDVKDTNDVIDPAQKGGPIVNPVFEL